MEELSEKVKTFLKERGWDKLRPSDLAKSISIEAAELLEIFQWESLGIDETKQKLDKMPKIKKELADIIIYALEMSTLLDIDMKNAVLEKLDHNSKKYPADLMKSRPREVGYTPEDPYIKIKESHRNKG